MTDLAEKFLNQCAWRMETPELFGSFHIISSVLAVLMALLLAYCVRRSIRIYASADHEARHVRGCSDDPLARRHLIRVLVAAGWVLILMEIFKQFFLYYIVNGGSYDWWYFPFQLCSVPMYLCVLLPFTKGKIQDAFLTFMAGYTLLSAAAALVYPQDMLRSYTALTIHGFVWHGILIFISFSILFCTDVSGYISYRRIFSVSGFLRATALFVVLSVIAVSINAAAEPAMAAGGFVHKYAAMFYLNPYHLSPQPAVSNVQMTYGIPAGLMLYELVIIAVSGIVILTEKILLHPSRNI